MRLSAGDRRRPRRLFGRITGKKRREFAERVHVIAGETFDARQLPEIDSNSRRSFYLHRENTVHDVLRLLRLPSSQESRLHTEAAGSAPPDAFGSFRVLHQIGNGALGPVFRAYDQERDRLAAVKLFRLDLPPERVHQLLGEFEKLIAVELQHPVIAAPRAAGIEGNSAYLAQDFAAADSLDIVIRENGAAPPAKAVRVAGQLAEALDYAADRQILHGALHPRDVLLSDDDIRIVGLGVARALERVGAVAPVRRPYAPPERINDEGWDRTADVFSLAAIVYELLCGKRITGIGSEAADSLGEVPGADMEALQRVFALALAADPSYRYATATAFTDALKDAMGIEVAPAKPRTRRARPKLRVVAAEPGEPSLPLDEVSEVLGVPEVPEVPGVPGVLEVLPVRVSSTQIAPRTLSTPSTPSTLSTPSTSNRRVVV
jgi:serine/threonine protein kinase